MFIAGALAVPAPVFAGSDTVEKVELIQVAQLFGASKKKTRESAELSLRVDGVEQEIRNLTGKLEELTFQLRQLQDQLRRMQEDNEFRFQQLESGGRRGSLTPATTPAPQQQGRQTAELAGASESRTDHVLGTLPGSYAEESGSGSEERSARSGPIDLSALARGNSGGFNSVDEAPAASEPTTETAATNLGAGDPGSDYESAYNRMLQGDYQGSERLFRDFLANHPDHHLAGNAQYWLGESLFARGLYRDASEAF